MIARRIAGAAALALTAAGGYTLWANPAEHYGLACLVGLLFGVAGYLLIPERRTP